ncbi:MAG: hypothetical protein HYV36_07570 [Lentisphaerae bacterium]|nr:hypothetical protein [Lentisphaerota bacterium]
MAADVPRVPVGKAGNVECPKCGYLFAAVLALCPRCQHQRHKGRVALRQGLRVATVVLIIVLGWLLAANFERLSGYVKALFTRMLE